MNVRSHVPILRVAALFCGAFLCRIEAIPLTITQTTTCNLFGHYDGSGGIGTTWVFAPFAAAGTLTSVQFDAQVDASLDTSDGNVLFSTPETWTPFVALNTFFIFPDFFNSPNQANTVFGPPTVLAPLQFGNFHTDILQTYSHVFMSDADLGNFTGTGFNRVIANGNFTGSSSFAGTNNNETITMTLTYTYTVPEGVSSISLLAIGLGALLVGHRLLPRGLRSESTSAS